MIAAVAGSGLLLLVAVITAVWGRWQDADPSTPDDVASAGTPSADERPSDDETKADRRPAADAAVENEPLGTLRVDTPKPGWQVFVDWLPAVDEKDRPLLTPCEIALPYGTHTVTVVRDGFRDESQSVSVADEPAELAFEPQADSSGTFRRLTDGAFFDLPVGKPVPLDSLNSPGHEFDPYLSADGLVILFAAHRAEGDGIYLAVRSTPYEPFEAPQLLRLTRGRDRDRPAGPALSSDGLTLVYTVPERARVYALYRDNPLRDFDLDAEKRPLRANRSPSVRYLAAFLDNRNTLYWLEQDRRGSSGDSSRRVLFVANALDEKAASRRPQEIRIGKSPLVLSPDARRAYHLEGTTLFRSLRDTDGESFGAPQPIAELPEEAFQRDPGQRQFWITGDEAWLVFSNAPAPDGDLYVMRLTPRLVPRGRRVPPKDRIASKTDPKSKTGSPDSDNRPDTSSENKPPTPSAPPEQLSYEKYLSRFHQLMSERKYAEARDLLERARAEKALATEADLLNWDADDLALIESFWKGLEKRLGALPAGTLIRIGRARVTFERFEDGQLVGRTSAQSIRKPLRELDAADLAALATTKAAEADLEPGALALAAFVWYDGTSTPRMRTLHLQRVGAEGDGFRERQFRRTLHLAELDIQRERLSQAVERLEELIEQAADSAVGRQAEQLRDGLYERVGWQPRGPRKWKRGPLGEWRADPGRSENSFLLSPKKYAGFELSLEWQTTGRAGQGGVFFRYPGNQSIFVYSQKIQLANDYGMPPDPQTTGALLNIEAPTVNAVRRSGEWNTLRLRVEGEKVQVHINGRLVLDTEAVDDALPKEGYIALDGVPGGIAYRKILVTPLEGESAAE